MKQEETNIEALIQDDKNFNRGTEEGQRLMNQSLERFGAGRSILIDQNNRIIAGNKTAKTYEALGRKKVRIIETTGDELIAVKRTDIDLDSPEGRELALADNATAKANLEWDEEVLQEVGISFEDWGVDFSEGVEVEPSNYNADETEEEQLARKKEEFDRKMAEGALDEDDPEYQEFLNKFEAKKTTDDCYTPELVYDAVADWVAKEYNLSRTNFVRPFYPGGDYQREKYKPTDVVVDNPPFSIMSEILQWYKDHGIRFFLFGPHLTLFSSSTDKNCTALPIGVTVTYANGAKINTSFLTNLEPRNIRFRSEPRLYDAIKKADEATQKELKRELPKYSYDKHLVCTSLLSSFSRYGIDFVVTTDESEIIAQFDSQKDAGKAIFGKGYLISDRLLAEREKAEREKAEREKASVWELSDRERAIIAELNKKSPS